MTPPNDLSAEIHDILWLALKTAGVEDIPDEKASSIVEHQVVRLAELVTRERKQAVQEAIDRWFSMCCEEGTPNDKFTSVLNEMFPTP